MESHKQSTAGRRPALRTCLWFASHDGGWHKVRNPLKFARSKRKNVCDGDEHTGRSAHREWALVFHARGLTKIYGSGTAEVRALDGGISIFSPENWLCCSVPGSGKTTLLNQLGPGRAHWGELRYRDIELTNADEQQLTPLPSRHLRLLSSIL
jgi:ABC-type transport system involved in cytochrome bd biosynthesis fused ATPase/permease subunit